jgi:hypothetical protein
MTLLEPLINNLGKVDIFLEKTPGHALFIPEIVQLLPQARFIHILRDPRDVVASLLAAHASWGSDWAPSNAYSAAMMWSNHIDAVHKSSKQLPPSQFLEVKYEDLQEQPVIQLRRCSEFLDLQWTNEEMIKALEINMASTARNTGGTAIPLRGEVAKRIAPTVSEPKGFLRKAEVGSWKSDLTLRDKIQVWRLTRNFASDLGYSWPAFDWLRPIINFVSSLRRRRFYSSQKT